MLGIPYTNAKVIYRVYRQENRVFSQKHAKSSQNEMENQDQLMASSSLMRQNAVRKLFRAMNMGVLSKTQTQRIFEKNFNEFVLNPILQNPDFGFNDLHSILIAKAREKRTLPVPPQFEEGKVNSDSSNKFI